jgi:hypothetical protein
MLLIMVAMAVAPLILLSVYRRRQGIRHFVKRVVLADVVYFSVAIVLLKAGQTPGLSVLAGLVCGLLVTLLIPRRRRYVPQSERRKAIARFEYKTGRKYNARTHEIDHVVPFTKGGSHTADNLQVIERGKNRTKGAKSPWWDLLGR